MIIENFTVTLTYEVQCDEKTGEIETRLIKKSIELLKKSNSNILDIAIECGFNNTANFNRAFKKMTNKVPSDYINR